MRFRGPKVLNDTSGRELGPSIRDGNKKRRPHETNLVVRPFEGIGSARRTVEFLATRCHIRAWISHKEKLGSGTLRLRPEVGYPTRKIKSRGPRAGDGRNQKTLPIRKNHFWCPVSP